jgi:hypothetical protein
MLLREPPSAEVLGTIKAITEALFPGPVDFAEEFDPAEPNSRYVVFTATAEGEWKDLRGRVIDWHAQVRAICPEPINYFRLEIQP